jgi:hypothetical protein
MTMVEFWMMLAMATTSGTVMGQMPQPPLYYTQQLCLDAAKELREHGGGEHFCVRAQPTVTLQTNIVTGFVHQ